MKSRRAARRKAVPGQRQPGLRRRMSVPAPGEAGRSGGRWDAIISALDSWQRTFRLCLILVVATVVSSGMTAVVLMLVRHMLLCGLELAEGGRGSREPGRGGATRRLSVC